MSRYGAETGTGAVTGAGTGAVTGAGAGTLTCQKSESEPEP
jgi:hypothetical protein